MLSRKDYLDSVKKLDLLKVDPLYSSYLYLKFVNRILLKGKKHKLETILYKTFSKISKSFKILPIFLLLPLFKESLLPLDFVKKKKGRRVYLVPVPVRYSRLYALVLSHISKNLKREKVIGSKNDFLYSFFHQVLSSKTNSFRDKRRSLIKQVIDNRAFKHFRWK